MKSTLNLNAWLEKFRDELIPPVANKRLFDDGDFILMMVGGPNSRSDYHIDPGEEFFFQLEGELTINIIENSERKEIRVGPGEMFLLEAEIPHSPQRSAGSLGLVVERKRKNDENDFLRWYCDRCTHTLFEASFKMKNIEEDLKPIIEHYKKSRELRLCTSCGHLNRA